MIRRNYLSRMLRGAILSAVLCGVSPSVMATPAEALVVYPTNSAELVFFLGDHPVFNYSERMLSIESGAVKAELNLPEVGVMKFETRESSGISTEKSPLSVDLSSPNAVKVYGLVPGTLIRAVTLAGVTVGTSAAEADGAASLSLESLSSGSVVIITCNNLTFKLIKK